jgi:signal transduction histidine kinase
MARLITDLLESERLAAPHAALHREPVDLVELAREVIAELGDRHPGAAAIRVLVPPALPALPLDRARLRLLLRNLLDNSLRHSEPGVPPPELHLRWQNEAVEIVVRDHGPGVPELEHLAQLATGLLPPRQRGASAPPAAVGLGLYLCRLVAQAHGGLVESAGCCASRRSRGWPSDPRVAYPPSR